MNIIKSSGIKSAVVPSFNEYIRKVCSAGICGTATPELSECCWAFAGATTSMGIIAYLTFLKGIPVLIASLGASACLIYGTPAAPFAQPRNVVLGQTLSAFVGVVTYQIMGCFWYSAALSVGVAVAAMLRFRIVHPPAAATALIAVLTEQGFLYPLLPVGVGAVILVVMGIIINNMASKRQYPRYWW